jgi:hypothetical protein
MLKDQPPKEPARRKAERKWRNHSVERNFKEERRKANAAPREPKEIKFGDVIENDRVIAGEIVRVQTKFANEIRDMLKHHTLRNIYLYKLHLRNQKKRLLWEKYKRLLAREAERAKLAEQPKLPWNKPRVVQDLFA